MERIISASSKESICIVGWSCNGRSDTGPDERTSVDYFFFFFDFDWSDSEGDFGTKVDLVEDDGFDLCLDLSEVLEAVGDAISGAGD